MSASALPPASDLLSASASLTRRKGYRCPGTEQTDIMYSRQAIEAVLSGLSNTELLERVAWPDLPREAMTLVADTPSRSSVFVAGV